MSKRRGLIGVIIGIIFLVEAFYNILGFSASGYPLYLSEDGNVTESPAYSVQLFSEKRSYDLGEKVFIAVYIAGRGNIEQSLLWVHIPEKIISGNAIFTCFKFLTNETGSWPIFSEDLNSPEQVEVGHRFAVGLAIPYFFPRPGDREILWCEDVIIDPLYGREYAPLSLNFTIHENAPAGDHKVEFVFKYMAEGKWYLAKETEIIHIRSTIAMVFAQIIPIIIVTVLIPFSISILKNILNRKIRRYAENVIKGYVEKSRIKIYIERYGIWIELLVSLFLLILILYLGYYLVTTLADYLTRF